MNIVNTGRRTARTLLMQSLYAFNISKCTIKEALNDAASVRKDKYDINYFAKVSTFMTVDNILAINNIIAANLDIEIDKITKVELSVLQLALYEYINCIDVPSKVILNEALEITKEYGSTDGHKLINGVLDKVFKERAR